MLALVSATMAKEPAEVAFKDDQKVQQARSRFKSELKRICAGRADEEEEIAFDNGFLGGLSWKEIYANGPQGLQLLTNLPKPNKPSNTFIMKLYDRSIDLAQFMGNNSPLYPVTRAWFKNTPHEDWSVKGNEEEAGSQSSDEEVTQLPPPEPLPLDAGTGRKISLRIASPLPPEDGDFGFDILNYRDDDAPNPAELFQNHLDRWYKTRQRWKDAANRNEKRFEKSFAVLKRINEQSLKFKQEQKKK